ncbi:MAG: DUF4189 domain-containing protein, partial [Pseudorhizobium sp.]
AAFVATILSCAYTTTALATGAIAVNDGQGISAEDAGYGLGYGGSKKEASANAVRECKSAGNDSCEVVLTFEQCGAYIGNKAYYATGVGATEKAAQQAAKAECADCKLIVSDCH